MMDRSEACPFLTPVTADRLWLYPTGAFCRRPGQRLRVPAAATRAPGCGARAHPPGGGHPRRRAARDGEHTDSADLPATRARHIACTRLRRSGRVMTTVPWRAAAAQAQQEPSLVTCPFLASVGGRPERTYPPGVQCALRRGPARAPPTHELVWC